MASFVPIDDDASFTVVGVNYSNVANFGSTTNTTFMRIYANDNSNAGYQIGVVNNGSTFIIGPSQSNTNAASADLVISNDKVGINVATPAYALDVSGDVNFTNNLYYRGSNTNLFFNNGRLGVNTSNPQQALDVQGSLYVRDSVIASNLTLLGASITFSTVGANTLNINNQIASGPSLYVNQVAATSIAEFYDGADMVNAVFKVSNGRRVGINTANPQETLDVNGNARASRFVSTVAPGTAPLVVSSSNLVTNLNAQYISGLPANYFLDASNLNAGTLSELRLPQSGVASGTYGSSSNSVRVTVDAYGRVKSISEQAIQITSNQVIGLSKVATTGNYNDLSNITFLLSSGNAVYNNGNVGIGVDPPVSRLHVATTTGESLITLSSPSGNNAGIQMVKTTSPLDGAKVQYASVPNDMYIQRISGGVASNVVAVNLTSGNVGIGTSVANARLHVAGNTQIAGQLSLSNGAYITAIGNGTWIDMPTTGPSGIGMGGPGQSAWIAYASSGGAYFSDAVGGDICYRNLSGRLLFGFSSNNSVAGLTSSLAYFTTNVGVGTRTPGTQLDVWGTGKFTQNSATLRLAPQTANSESFMTFHQNADLAGTVWSVGQGMSNVGASNFGISVGISNVIALLANGNVGIGSTVPLFKLDVGNGNINIRNGNISGVFTSNQLTFESITGGYRHAIKSRHNPTGNDTNNAIDFYTWQTTDGSTSIGSKQIMSVTSAGIGVGLTNPSYQLDVLNTAQFRNDFIITANNGAWNSTAGKAIYMRYSTSGNQDAAYIQSVNRSTGGTLLDMRIQANNIYLGGGDGYERLNILSNGNVGIGMTQPTSRLAVLGRTEVDQDGSNIGSIVVAPQNANAQSSIGFYTNSNLTGATWLMGQGVYAAGVSNFSIGNNTASNVITMLLNGNVGIGSTTPTQTLDVIGNIKANTIYLESATVNDGNVDASNISNVYIRFGQAGTVNDWAYLRQIGSNNAFNLAIDFHDDGNDTGFVIRDVQSTTNPDTVTERFRVNRGGGVDVLNGNLGVGLSSFLVPQNRVDVAGSCAIGTYAGSNRAPANCLIVSDKIGVGTASPCNALDIFGGCAIGTFAGSNIAPSNCLIVSDKIGIGVISPKNALDVTGGCAFGSYAGACNAAANTVIVGGNVGIGTTVPAYRLSVYNQMSVTGVFNTSYLNHGRIYMNDNNFGIGCGRIAGTQDSLYFFAYDGTDRDIVFSHTANGTTDPSGWRQELVIKNTGNVGIGTTRPTDKLHVVGNVVVGGSTARVSYSNTLIPIASGTVNGVNITALNRLSRASYASAVKGTSTWISRSAPDYEWRSICWAPELSLFVAISSNSSSQSYVLNSTDGITWTTVTCPQSYWQNVCWSADRNIFVAVSGNGAVMTSSDGKSWSLQTAVAGNWTSVCWSPELGLFVAVSQGATTTHVMTSPNGINWTAISTPLDLNYASVCWSGELQLFVAVSYTGSGNRVMTSPDGSNWTIRTTPVDNLWVSVCWSPELMLFVAVSSTTNATNTIMRSSDGINWASCTAPLNIGYQSVCWAPELSMFVAVSSSQTTTGIITSPDGINWMSRTLPTSNGYYSVCWAPELSIFATVSLTGTGNRVVTSAPALPNSFNSILAQGSQLTLSSTTGNFGVGTSTPLYPLHVQRTSSNADVGIMIQNSGAGSNTTVTINMRPYSSSNAIAAAIRATDGINGSNAGTLQFFTASEGTTDANRLTQRMIINQDGNVGVGTTNPSHKVDVIGTMRVVQDGAGTGSVRIAPAVTGNEVSIGFYDNSNMTGSNNWIIGRGAFGVGASNFAIGKNSNIMTITDGGNIGIGTTAPAGKLHLYGQNDISPVSLILENTSERTTTTPVNYIKFRESSGTSVYDTFGIACLFGNNGNLNKFMITSSTANVDPRTADAKITMLQDGSVGIGSTTPTSILDVKGLTNESYLTLRTNANNNLVGVRLFEQGDIWGAGMVYDGFDDKFHFTTYRNSATATKLMTIYYDGNVGIGTTIPNQKLVVVGNIDVQGQVLKNGVEVGVNASNLTTGTLNASLLPSSGATPGTYGDASNVPTIVVDSYGRITSVVNTAINASQWTTYSSNIGYMVANGNVGIGVSNPTQKLVVAGNIDVQGLVLKNGSEVGIDASKLSTGTLNISRLPTSTATPGTYGDFANVPTITVDSYGRITNVANTAINASQWITSGCNISYTVTNGNVGIGYTNPAYKLAVNGSAYINGTVFTSNLTVLGDTVTLNTTTSNTEQFFITNTGSGPAMQVTQTGPQPVATFYDDSNIALMIADQAYVGINMMNPQYPLDVTGNASFRNVIYTNNQVNNCVICLWNNTASVPGNPATATLFYGFGVNTSALRYNTPTSSDDHIFYAGATELARIKGSGSLGVGTNPADRLHVTGGKMRIVNDNTCLSIAPSTPQSEASISFHQSNTLSGTSWTLGQNVNSVGTNNLALGVSGTGNIMSFLQTGNVGIGVAAPSYKLHVGGQLYAHQIISYTPSQGSSALKLTCGGNTAGDQWWMSFNHGGATTDNTDRARIGVNIMNGGQGRLWFTTGAVGAQQVAMWMDENQNIGIGTTSPMFKVHSTNSVFIGDYTFASNIIPASVSNITFPPANGARLVFDNTLNQTVGSGTAANKIVLHNNNWTGGFGVEYGALTYHVGGGGGAHNFYVGANNTSYGSLKAAVNTTGIQMKGKVYFDDVTGVNGARPTQGVHLFTDYNFGMELQGQYGTWNTAFVTRAGDGGFAFKKSDGTAMMYMSSNNNVGIGTTVPLERLHVSGSNMLVGTRFMNRIFTQTNLIRGTTYSNVMMPVSDGRINGINLTALNKLSRATYASTAKTVSTWITRTAPNQTWYSVCWAPELTRFVAVGNDGTAMTSSDSITWTPVTVPGQQWYNVIWAPEVRLFVAVAFNTGQTTHVMTSPNGTSWTGITTADSQWRSVCWAPELSLFVAVASNSSNVLASIDGVTWTTRATGNVNTWNCICWSPELGLFVAAANTGTGNRVMTSPDGTNWTTRTTPSGADVTWQSICWSPELGMFAAVSISTGTFNHVMTSQDGVNWTLVSVPVDLQWWSICWAAELSIFVSVAASGTGNRIMTSQDGMTWTTQTSPADNPWYSVCWAPELSMFVSVANGAASGNGVMTSAMALPSTGNTVMAPPTQFSISPSTGYLGVGTSNAQYNVDIVGAQPTLRLFDNRGDGNAIISMKEFSDNFGYDIAYLGLNTNDNKLHFRAYNNSATPRYDMTIDRSSGNIGIGTSSPAYRLDLNGGPLNVRNGNGNGAFGNNQLILEYVANNYRHAIKSRHNASADNTNNAIDFFIWQTTDAVSSVGTKHVMSVTSTGVGIGTTNPQGIFDVRGDATIISCSNSNISQQLTIRNEASSGRAGLLLVPSNNSAYQAQIYTQPTGGLIITPSANSSFSLFFPITGEVIRANGATGAIGIGTWTPQNRLDVYGGCVVGTDYAGLSNAPTSGMLISGNVGIGTTNAYQKMVVNGNIDVLGQVLKNGAEVGVNASNLTTGTLAAARLPPSGVVPGIYGNTSNIPSIVIDQYGRITSVVNSNITIDASSVASGTLSSSRLPSTGVAPAIYGTSSNIPILTVDATGRITLGSNSSPLANVATSGNYNDLSNRPLLYTGSSIYNTTGSLGIGTSTPLAAVQIRPTTATDPYANGLLLLNDRTTSNDHSIIATSVTSNGGNPYISFDVANQAGWSMGIDNADSRKFKMYTSNVFKTGSNAFTIDRRGNIGIGTEIPAYPLHVNGNIFATNVISYSDRKYKTDIHTIDNPLDLIQNIRGVSYKLQSDPYTTYLGVIAQEVEPYIPEVVHTDASGLKSVSYGNMVAVLIEAVKTLTKRVDQQAEEIKELKLALQPN